MFLIATISFDDVANFLARGIDVETGELRQVDGFDQRPEHRAFGFVVGFRSTQIHGLRHRRFGLGIGTARLDRRRRDDRRGEAVRRKRHAAGIARLRRRDRRRRRYRRRCRPILACR